MCEVVVRNIPVAVGYGPKEPLPSVMHAYLIVPLLLPKFFHEKLIAWPFSQIPRQSLDKFEGHLVLLYVFIGYRDGV